MNKPWKVIAAFFGVFLAGAVFGGFLSLRVARQRVKEGFTGKPPAMNQFVPMILRKYGTRLELTPEQLEKVRPIVKATDEELRQLRRTNFADSIAAGERMNAAIAAILTPEQKEKLEEMKREFRERWDADRLRRNRDRQQVPPQAQRPEAPAGEMPPPPPPT